MCVPPLGVTFATLPPLGLLPGKRTVVDGAIGALDYVALQ